MPGYVSVAIVWLWLVEKQTPTPRDIVGVGLCLVGMAVIATAPSLDLSGEGSAAPDSAER